MMRLSLLFSLIATSLILMTGCAQQQMMAAVRDSRTVVLDIGHYDTNRGATSPDARHGGTIDEFSFWYNYASEIKKTIEEAGYDCIVTNRADYPADKELAKHGKSYGVVQINSPDPKAIYRSTQHPKRCAVGMLPVNYALDREPACVVFLHHNSASNKWTKTHSAAIYCNQIGVTMAQSVALELNRNILNSEIPNGGRNCGIIVRNDGRLGGGDWLNACQESYVPAVITEALFLSNPEHVAALNQDKKAKKLARTIGQSIVNYLNQR